MKHSTYYLIYLGVAVSIAIIILLILYFPSNKPILGPSLIKNLFNNTYSLTSSKCVSSQQLIKGGILQACTETLKNTNPSSLAPQTLVAFTYKFSNNTNAQNYVRNISYNLNATPWPRDITTQFKIVNTSNLSIYYTSIALHSKGYYHVTTAYIVKGNEVIAASAENKATMNYKTLEIYTTKLLYILYNKSFK